MTADRDLEKERRAVEWIEACDDSVGVGARHHTVPRFYLQRFANSANQVYVRDRVSGQGGTRNIGDLAVKDFYTTFLKPDRRPSGWFEQLLSEVEALASPVFRKILNPFLGIEAVSDDERCDLALYIAFQMTRTTGFRREQELMLDYGAKLQMAHLLKVEQLARVGVLAHQNEHIRHAAKIPRVLFPYIVHRPMVLATLDSPLLLTCDDPVVLYGTQVHHLASCSQLGSDVFSVLQPRSGRRRKDRRKKGSRTIHMHPTRPRGIALATELLLPLSPSSALVLGPLGRDALASQFTLAGPDAALFAEELNAAIVDRAFEWVVGHPENSMFRELAFPPVGPLLQVCDGNSPVSQQLNGPPSPRRPARFSAWKPRSSGSPQ